MLNYFTLQFFHDSRNVIFLHVTAVFVNMLVDAEDLKETLHRSCCTNFQLGVVMHEVFRT